MKTILSLGYSMALRANTLEDLLGDGRKSVHEDHPHFVEPLVGSSKPDYCTKAVDRLKAGPANIPKIQCAG